MTHPEEEDRDLTPEEDARLRAPLASARADDGVPDDVAARLDATLAELREERAGSLARTRRQRRGRWVLGLAAAAVVAVAVAQLPRLGGGANDASGGASSADSAASGKAPSADSAETGGGGGSASTYALRSKNFRADVRRLLDGYGAQRLEAAPAPDDSAARSCAPTVASGTRQQVVELDGQTAVLEVRRSRDGSRLVRAVSCDGDQTLASTRIPAP